METKQDLFKQLEAIENLFSEGLIKKAQKNLRDPSEVDFGSELTTTFCVTNCPFIECQGDFNNDGVINLMDLLDLLPNIVG